MILRLAPLARTDLVEIWRYSAATWSSEQADDYLDALRDFLLRLAEIPLLGRPAGLQVDLYRFPHASHVSTTGSLTTRSRSSGCSINGWTRSVICRVAPARRCRTLPRHPSTGARAIGQGPEGDGALAAEFRQPRVVDRAPCGAPLCLPRNPGPTVERPSVPPPVSPSPSL